MKKTFQKYIIKSIKKDFSRLIAIFLIVLMGIGFLIGLTTSSTDLKASIDSYYDRNNFLDVYIQSTIGFNDDDVDFLKSSFSEIKNIEGYYQIDDYGYLNGEKTASRIIYKDLLSTKVDKISLVEGDFPSNENECLMLVEKGSSASSYSIGDTFSYDDKEYKIVGKVRDPFYVSNLSESTTIGSGYLGAVVYIDSEFISESLSTTIIKMTFSATKEMNSFSDEYTNYVKSEVSKIEECADARLELRETTLKETIREEVTKAVKEEITKSIVEKVPALEGTSILDALVNSLLNNDSYQEAISTQTEEVFKTSVGTVKKWYVLSRKEVQSYAMVKEDINKIGTVTSIFPVYFFAIALFVSITSLTKIIENDRAEIGTLRSIGYPKRKIYQKYIFYSLGTTILGSGIGAVLGTFLLPLIIMNIYSLLYDIPSFIYLFDWPYFLIFGSIMVLMIFFTALVITHNCLREHVSNLMLFKAPKPGKKILLEKIPFIWNHLRFKQKSMFRNVFRYKKNLLMIVLGVGGCTSILLAVFGLNDSMGLLNTKQYQELITYDLIVQVENIDSNPIDSNYSSEKVYYMQGEVLGKGSNLDVELISSNNLPDYIGFTGNNEFTSTSVVVTNQIAKELNLSTGDMIAFKNDDDNSVTQFSITDVTENYIGNYIYVGESALLAKYSDISKNAIVAKTSLSSEELKIYMRNLLEDENVKSITSLSDMKELYDSILNNLGSVVLILVFLSGALVAVVIYNLTDIMLLERIREIATLQVTGYTRGQSLSYIFKEIVFMSIIGILLGLGLGVLLHHFVMDSISSIGLCFSLYISPWTYIYSIGIILVFIILTSLLFFPKVKHIKMAEALKSNE